MNIDKLARPGLDKVIPGSLRKTLTDAGRVIARARTVLQDSANDRALDVAKRADGADVAKVTGRVTVLSAIVADAIQERQRGIDGIDKRLRAIEAQPAPGGPVVRAVPGARFDDAPEDPVLKAIDTLARHALDPELQAQLAAKRQAHLAERGRR